MILTVFGEGNIGDSFQWEVNFYYFTDFVNGHTV